MTHAKRLEKAKRIVAKVDYVQKEGIHCKLCGRLIVGLVQIGEMKEDPIHGKYKQMGQMVLPEYCYVDIETVDKDGKLSKHSTPLCKPCANKLSQDDLENIYAIDINQFEKEAPMNHVRENKPTKVISINEI